MDEPRSPLFAGEPVIVVHLATSETTAPHLAACSGEVFRPPSDTAYPQVPRVPCPACVRPR